MSFAQNWTAEILKTPPLIAPARQYVWPERIPGEEDALARGALLLNVRPASGGNYLVTCALGFRDPSMPTGIFACPDPDQICAVAGGYAYIADARAPDRPTHIPLRPVAAIHPAPEAGLLLFAGFHTVLGWGRDGGAWQTARLTWEGLRVTGIEAHRAHGLGWDLRTDEEVPFTIDLATGEHQGGGFRP
jgi:hypothetical protein